jgi:hypothetical protein
MGQPIQAIKHQQDAMNHSGSFWAPSSRQWIQVEGVFIPRDDRECFEVGIRELFFREKGICGQWHLLLKSRHRFSTSNASKEKRLNPIISFGHTI